MQVLRTIRNFYIAGVSLIGVSYLYRTHVRKSGSLVRVLVFHDVQDGKWFRDILSLLQTQYTILTPEAFRESRFDTDRINVLITFDDGYASWTDVCLPILREKNIQALFFINSGLIDCYGNTLATEKYVLEQLLLSSRTTLSWTGVHELREAGHTIGGHTTTHVRLSKLQSEVQKTEIVGDKERIEAMIGEKITMFAYPFGVRNDYTDTTLHMVKDAGYTHAFTTEGAFVRMNDFFKIPRLCVEDAQSTRSLAQWVEGGFDLYLKLKNLCVR